MGPQCCDLLAVLNELHPNTLPDGRIWPFDFNLYFSQHNLLCMGGNPKPTGFKSGAQVDFLVLFIMPLPVLSMTVELPGSSNTMTLDHPTGATGRRERGSSPAWPVKKTLRTLLFLLVPNSLCYPQAFLFFFSVPYQSACSSHRRKKTQSDFPGVYVHSPQAQ